MQQPQVPGQVPELELELEPEPLPRVHALVLVLQPVQVQSQPLQRGPGPPFQSLEQPVAQALLLAPVAQTTCL